MTGFAEFFDEFAFITWQAIQVKSRKIGEYSVLLCSLDLAWLNFIILEKTLFF